MSPPSQEKQSKRCGLVYWIILNSLCTIDSNSWSWNTNSWMWASPHCKVSSFLPKLNHRVPGSQDRGEVLTIVIETTSDEKDITGRLRQLVALPLTEEALPPPPPSAPVGWHWCRRPPSCQSFSFNVSKGACQKKNTGFFGSFSQMSDPPLPPPLFGRPPSKKKLRVYFTF